MKTLSALACTLPLLLAACTTTKPAASGTNEIYWVSGTQVVCSAGAGKMMCLRVSKHPDLNQAQWQYFYAPIEGFVFKDGIAKKIEVRTTALDPETVPADAPAVRYTLVRELEQRAEPMPRH